MKWISTTILSLFTLSTTFAQDLSKTADSILAEGQLLYKSEVTSWYGTDAFLQRYSDRANIGGYFSYAEDSITKCIFFSKGDAPAVLGTIVFHDVYSADAADVNMSSRAFTEREKTLYDIRMVTMKELKNDTMFKVFQKTSLNLIPVVTPAYKRVYILTGPQVDGVALFGNDYLLTFNPDNTLKEKKKLHKSLVQLNYGESKEPLEGAMHSHLPEYSPFVTSTDICTLLLYGPFANLNQYYVVSKDYISIYNAKPQLVILTMDAWKKIAKDAEKRQSKKN